MPQNDGKDLEEAAKSIERLFRGLHPQSAGKEITIELRKRQKFRGVLYEFDLWIEIEDAGLFLIECKDSAPKYPVGPDVISYFDEKMQQTNAIGGYIVARGFTRSARARAEWQPRLTLQVMDENLASLAHITDLHQLRISVAWEECRLYLNGGGPEVAEKLTGDTNCIYRGEQKTVNQLFPEFHRRAVAERMENESTDTVSENSPYRIEYSAEYDAEDLMVDDFAPLSVSVKVVFDVELLRPTISWHYNFIERGVTRRYRHETELAETVLTRVETDEGSSGTEITLVTRSGSTLTFMDDVTGTEPVQYRIIEHR